jgi:formylglycine-generating enzyme required for sulfatase activity
MEIISGDGVGNGLPNTNVYGGISQTGQTGSYDENGTPVSRGNLFDDGYYRAGVYANFQRDTKREIVYDGNTHLTWEDTAHTVNTTMTQKKAHQYCKNLSVGGIDNWRLPTLNELRSLILYDDDNTTVFPTAFRYGSDDKLYWSGTLGFASTPYGINFDTNGALTVLADKIAHNIGPSFVRCVSGDSQADDVFERHSNMVTNVTQGIDWQDNRKPVIMTNWKEAIDYCENLDLGGYRDWRLPTINELMYSGYGARKYMKYKINDTANYEALPASSTTYSGECYSEYINDNNQTRYKCFDALFFNGDGYSVTIVAKDVSAKKKITSSVNITFSVRCIRGGTVHKP